MHCTKKGWLTHRADMYAEYSFEPICVFFSQMPLEAFSGLGLIFALFISVTQNIHRDRALGLLPQRKKHSTPQLSQIKQKDCKHSTLPLQMNQSELFPL